MLDRTEDAYFKHVEDPTVRAAARAATDVLFAGLDRMAWWTIGRSLAVVAAAMFTRKVNVQDMAFDRSDSGDVDTD